METATILRQSFEVYNNFDEKQCLTAISAQLSDQIFKELINGEKHHLVLNFSIDVVQETNEEKTNRDPDRAKAMEIINKLKKAPKEKLEILGLDGYMLWIESVNINTDLK